MSNKLLNNESWTEICILNRCLWNLYILIFQLDIIIDDWKSKLFLEINIETLIIMLYHDKIIKLKSENSKDIFLRYNPMKYYVLYPKSGKIDISNKPPWLFENYEVEKDYFHYH